MAECVDCQTNLDNQTQYIFDELLGNLSLKERHKPLCEICCRIREADNENKVVGKDQTIKSAGYAESNI